MLLAFTGAGISKDSGIPTFEERPDLRDRLTLDIWREDPQLVWETIWEMYESVRNAHPNPAHLELARAKIPVITQNIDGLHHKAGTPSDKVLELHGNLRQARCVKCSALHKLEEIASSSLPACQCGGLLKPDVVLYQEPVENWWKAFDIIAQASVLLVVGTSLTVSPAAELPALAERNGTKVLIINKNAEIQLPKLLRGKT